jgi:hypothetical protein
LKIGTQIYNSHKYDGHSVLVGGTVDFVTNAEFRFKIPGTDAGVLAKTDDDSLAQLKPDQWIKVRCESVSQGPITPILDDCTLPR